MTRRILFMLIGFTAIVLVGAVVPLTLNATDHDRSSFIQATAGMDRGRRGVAQARLDGSADQPLLVVFNQTRQAGDALLIIANQVVNGACVDLTQVSEEGMPAGNWGQLACQADRQGQLANQAGQPVQPKTRPRARGSSRPCPSTSAARARWWAR